MNIVISGNYGAGNFGDELILEGLLQTLHNITKDAKITVLSNTPKETAKKYEVNSLYKFPAGIRSLINYFFTGKFFRTLNAVRKCDYFVMGGGGLFDTSKKRSILIWEMQARFAYLLKKPVIMYGQSIGEIKDDYFGKIIRKLFRKAHFVAMRDEFSKNELKKYLKGKKIYTMPDLVFNIPQSLKSDGEAINKQNQVLFALRDLGDSVLDGKILELIKYFQEKEFADVIFVPFQEGSDEQYGKKLTNTTKLIPHQESRKDMEKLYNESRMLVGMRLHSVLFAIRMGLPFIAISYSPKVKNILDSLGLSKLYVNPDELSVEKVREMEETYRSIDFQKILESQSKKHREIEEQLKTALSAPAALN